MEKAVQRRQSYCGDQADGSMVNVTIRNRTYVNTNWLYSVNPGSEDAYTIVFENNTTDREMTKEKFN